MLDDYRKSLAAGLTIAMGGYMFIHLHGGIAGAIFFSIGLLTVCIYGMNLYTGKICYFTDERREKGVLWYLMVLAGNLTAAILFGLFSSICALSEAQEFVEAISSAKMAKPLLQVFLSGVACNIFIYIAVNTWKSHKDIIGVVVIIMCVTGFIITGSEHCVADAFYFATARADAVNAIQFLAVCIMGNTAGGIIAHAII